MAGADQRLELRAEDVRQLWSLACLLAQENLIAQTTQCLEVRDRGRTAQERANYSVFMQPLCAVDCSTRSAEEQGILLQANVLLAEICSVTCSNSKKAEDRELWSRRSAQIDRCVYSAEAARERGIPCNDVNKLRLLKIKFLRQQQIKAERTAKDRRMLELLCEGLRSCTEAQNVDDKLVTEFREYFGVKLKACLVKMHTATVLTKYAKDNDVSNFADNLKFLRATLPNYVDKSFLLWLVEVTCHTAISSFRTGSTMEMRKLVEFGQEFFDKVTPQQPVSPDFRLHHLMITGFYFLRTGRLSKVSPVLDQIEALMRATGGDDEKPTGVLKEAYLNTIVDSIRMTVLARSDPNKAIDLALNTIHATQANLKTYAGYPAVRTMLIATLFDMLYLYCRLLGVQCRYADMGAGIVQMTALFVTYKADLERTIFYRFFLAQCHTLIAKYATAIGKVKNACSHLNYVVDKVLPAPTVEESSYPDAYLAVWVDVLEVATYCCGVATSPTFQADGSISTGVQVKQIYPSPVLLEWAAGILKSSAVQHQIIQCCSVELRAKFDLALAKWMWATEKLNGTDENIARFTKHSELEELRPTVLRRLHDSLQRMNLSVMCSETTYEVMALLGAFEKAQQGEDMLTNAIQASTSTKNVLLQTRLLAAVFELYASKKLVKAKAAVAAKYEKKVAVLQRRIAAAQAEENIVAALLQWTAGKTSTPSRG